MLKLYLAAALLLVLRLGLYWLANEQIQYPAGQTVSLTAALDSEPKQQEALQTFKIGDYTIMADDTPAVHYGDRVEVKGKTNCPRKAAFCSQAQIYRPEVRLLAPGNLNFWWRLTADLRSRIKETYQSILPSAEANLLSGILLGNQGLDRNFKDKLAKTGLSHVVAASGMNVSLFSVGAFWLLSYLSIHKRWKVFLVIGMILFYSTLTGFDPPIVRAVLMAVFALVGGTLGRQSSGFVGLLTAAFIMLWATPDLITNPSFLLSFSAMASQIGLSTVEFKSPKVLAPVMEVLLQTMAAILATFPIVLIFFTNFSIFSPITNILVLWTVEPLMVLGGLIATFGIFFTPASQVLALPAQGLLGFFLGVVDFFASSKWAVIRLSFSDNIQAALFAAGYYLVLLSAVWWLRNRRVCASIQS